MPKRAAEVVRMKPEHEFDLATVRDTEAFAMLKDIDAERRSRIASFFRIDAKETGEVCARIALALLEPDHVETLWREADPIERTLLRAASATPRLGRGTLTRCALDRRHSPAEIDQRIARLEREGILLWREIGFTPGFSVPPEVSRRLKRAIASEAIGPQVQAKPAGPACDHAGAFLDDVVTTLAFLKRGAYRVTRGGAVHAADLKRLGARLVYPEDVDMPSANVPGGMPPVATSEPFPTRLGLALDLVRRLLLVRFDPTEIKVDDRRAKQWLARNPDEVRRDLLKAARREPWRHQREVSAVGDFLSDRRPGEWILVEDVARALEYHPDFLGCRPEQLRHRVQIGATYLCWLGVAAVSPQENNPDAISLTPMGERLLSDEPLDASGEDEAKLHVLPDFEVILPSAAPLVVRYALEVFAEPADSAPGPVRRYRLEKRTLLQALKGGLTLSEVLSHLRDHASAPEGASEEGVPENVRISLEEWARAYGEYYFMNPTLLVCRDAAAAAAAKSDPKIAERVLGSLTPEILILSEGAVEPVRAALETNGSMPRAGLEEIPPMENPTTPEERRAVTAAAISRFILKRASDRALLDAPDAKSASAAPAIEDALLSGERPADAPPAEERRASKLCVVTGCGRPHAARGLCTLHYQAARRGKMSFPTV